eukprot:TRINITY_DN9768_c0_g1_i1.p1 TRINITY_DN9768_c0_g1~~TRINITY_DN9768_c0_g1_i1.p1  ORF type:complete len:229 (+),score=25.78 TRINITY_DN9768_c0_g1_i1:41-727(+)
MSIPDDQERRIDPEDGYMYPKSSFLEVYGPHEGERRWSMAGGYSECSVIDCPRQAEVFCHECRAAFCSQTCMVHSHRLKKCPHAHNKITYTLAGARHVIENQHVGSVSPSQEPSPFPDHRTAAHPHLSHVDSRSSMLHQLQSRKAAALQVEDYGEAQRIKEMIDSIHTQPLSPQPGYVQTAPLSPRSHPGHSPHGFHPAVVSSPGSYYQPHPLYTPPGGMNRVGEWSL